jgi:photosystem II stability/assembly factor-like uncharacterized protein
MKSKWSSFVILILAVILLSEPDHARAEGKPFQDPMDTPAIQEFGARGITQQSFMAITQAGKRLIAVGLRGLVVFSDDSGRSWQQARVPVQTDLVAVQFVTSRQGWASGHDAVILHTEDSGATWTKQFDNRLAAVVLPAYYQRKIAAGDTSMGPFLKQVELNTQGDTSLPLLGIHFTDLEHGIAVGSFGMIVATSDGGRHWLPWLDRINDKEFLNLNVIREIGNDLVIAGEQGGVYRYDDKTGSFVAVPAPYKGSFFDIVGTDRFMLAVGLRGTVYRSDDRGKTWQHIDTPVKDTVTAATLLGGSDGIVLVTAGGALVVSSDRGVTFRADEPLHPMLFTAVSALGADRLVLTGLQGIGVEQLTMRHAWVSSEVSQ